MQEVAGHILGTAATEPYAILKFWAMKTAQLHKRTDSVERGIMDLFVALLLVVLRDASSAVTLAKARLQTFAGVALEYTMGCQGELSAEMQAIPGLLWVAAEVTVALVAARWFAGREDCDSRTADAAATQRCEVAKDLEDVYMALAYEDGLRIRDEMQDTHVHRAHCSKWSSFLGYSLKVFGTSPVRRYAPAAGEAPLPGEDEFPILLGEVVEMVHDFVLWWGIAPAMGAQIVAAAIDASSIGAVLDTPCPAIRKLLQTLKCRRDTAAAVTGLPPSAIPPLGELWGNL